MPNFGQKVLSSVYSIINKKLIGGPTELQETTRLINLSKCLQLAHLIMDRNYFLQM